MIVKYLIVSTIEQDIERKDMQLDELGVNLTKNIYIRRGRYSLL